MRGPSHVNRKKLAGAGGVAIGAATAVTALLIGSTAAVADESGPASSAYGLSASGLLKISPVPYVESKDGEPAHDRLLKLAPNKDLSVGVLTVDALGGSARTSVAELNVLGLLRADLITTSCKNGDGALEIINGSVLGTKLPENPIAGQKIDVSPLLTVTLGDQTRNDDGSITVTGIELRVLSGHTNRDEKLTEQEKSALPALSSLLDVKLPAAPVSVGDVLDSLTGTLVGDQTAPTVTIGSATCGTWHEGGGGHADKPATDQPAPAADEAPKPVVVEGNLPVTG